MQQNVPNIAPAFAQGGLGLGLGPSDLTAGSSSGGDIPSLPFNLDPFTAKQMAALQATSLAKAGNRSAPGGTSASYFGGMSMNESHAPFGVHPVPHPHSSPNPTSTSRSFPPLSPTEAQAPIPPGPGPSPSLPMNPAQAQNPAAMQHALLQRKRSWLAGLANLMIQRGTPLPPQLTGVPLPPGYNPANMPWRTLDVNPDEIGVVRLVGKDVDLFRLWSIVLQGGGCQRVSQKNAWPLVMRQFDLPEAFPVPSTGEIQPTYHVLERYYITILGDYEEAYRKSLAEQSQRAALASGRAGPQQGPPNPPSRPGGMPGMPNMPGPSTLPGGNAAGMNMIPPTAGPTMDGPLPAGGMPANGASHPAMNGNGINMVKGPQGGFPAQNGAVDMEHELESRKRKMQEAVESEAKRARQKTAGSDVSESRSSVAPPPSVEGSVAAPITRTIRQPSRRKIEYVPYAREIDTAGGRDLDLIQTYWHSMSTKPVRHIEEWGQVDIDALTLSLRSRVSTEMSYALTTFTLLTLLRGSNQGGGFPVMQAPELLDEMVDLVEDLAFDGAEDDGYPDDDAPIVTHKQLVNHLLEDGTKPFAALERHQGDRDPDNGPRHRPAEIILVVINIIRNLSLAAENQEYLAKHEKLLPVMLRLCALAPAKEYDPPLPRSPVLSLGDLVSIRKDVMNTLLNISMHVALSPPSTSKEQLLTVRRACEVLASYIVDVTEAISPFQCILQSGIPPAVHQPKPPGLADMALETFSRYTLPDDNRQVVSQAVPQSWLWTLFEALVHRLPVADNDFQVIMRDVWLTYVERLIMALYSLAFLAPPAVKARAQRDGQLGFAKVMLRLVKKFTVHAPPELRHHFAISVRRAVEALRLVDAAADAFDPGRTAVVPPLAFGMGYGEHGDTRQERGMGLLSGYQEDITLGLMLMHPDIVDATLFSELESLVRVGH